MLTGGWCHSSPAICDIDSDGEMEVVVALTYPGNTGLVSLKGSNGSLEWCFPVMSASSPAIGDVDDDDTLEVLYCGADSLYCIDGVSGNLEWGFPCFQGNFMSSPTLINVDSDSALEIFFGTYDSFFYCVDGETGLEEWSEPVSSWIGYATPAAADLDSDGKVEVVFVAQNGGVHCRDGETGSIEWDYNLGGTSRDADPSIADIDGDGSLEVIVMSDGGDIYFLDGASGSLEWTYPGGGYHYVVPADVDGDGWLELVYVSNTPSYRIVCLDNIPGGIGSTVSETSSSLELSAIPNPFKEKVDIRYSIEQSAEGNSSAQEHRCTGAQVEAVELRIYDVSGRLVKSFSPTTDHSALSTAVSWDGRDSSGRSVPAGIYFLKIKVGNNQTTTKLLRIK